MMKVRLASLIAVSSICCLFAEPGGSYILTGNEKGITEIVKADMEKYPELYKDESLKSYLFKFKSENEIGHKKYKPGDQLHFPETIASLKSKTNTDKISAQELVPAKVYAKISFTALQDGKNVYKNPESPHFVNVPDFYSGWQISMVEKDNKKDPLYFTVKEAGLVFILVKKNVSKELIGDEWEIAGETSEQAGNGNKHIGHVILKKHFSKGEYSIPSYDQFGTRLLK